MFDPRVHVGVSATLTIRHPETSSFSVLMVHRVASATHGGNTWGLPGGWLDWKEDPVTTAARELHEECNVLVDPARGKIDGIVVNMYDDLEMHVLCVNVNFYSFNDSNLRTMEPEKQDEARWIASEDLNGLDLFPPARSLFELWKWI